MNTRTMKLVKPMNEAQNEEAGKLTVWRTEGSLNNMALELSADLTANGERLIVVDAAGCFDPSTISRAEASVARNLNVIRTVDSADFENTLGPALQSAQERSQSRRVLIVGLLDHLYSRDIITREAARALGRMKRLLDTLTKSGLEIVVVCKSESADLGARNYLVPSLCAAADEVYGWPLTTQQYIDGASAAIA